MWDSSRLSRAQGETISHLDVGQELAGSVNDSFAVSGVILAFWHPDGVLLLILVVSFPLLFLLLLYHPQPRAWGKAISLHLAHRSAHPCDSTEGGVGFSWSLHP